MEEISKIIKSINIQIQSTNVNLLQSYKFDDGQIDPVSDSPLTVVLRLPKKLIEDILNLPF